MLSSLPAVLAMNLPHLRGWVRGQHC